MTVVHIDPTAEPGGNGSLAHPFNSWSEVSFAAGNTYLQKANTTTSGVLYDTASSVTIGAYGPGAVPQLNGVIDLVGASHVTVQHLAIENPTGPGIALQSGANAITIKNDVITNSAFGIWIGNDAGGGDLIEHNNISGNSETGIGVSQIAVGSSIINNTVNNNGWYGIDIDGDNFTVSGNTVDGNGLAISGVSGIHVYGGAPGAPDGFGAGNTVTDNITNGNHDATGQDGNGIDLNQYTHDNIVLGNTAKSNDGAGIVLYDSYSNAVIGNLLVSNEKDPGDSHAVAGQLALNEDVGDTHGNYIAANVGISTSNSSAVFIDSVTASDDNAFSDNTWENLANGAATQIGVDMSWADWQLLGPTDLNGGIPLSAARYDAGTLDYSSLAYTYGAILAHGF